MIASDTAMRDQNDICLLGDDGHGEQGPFILGNSYVRVSVFLYNSIFTQPCHAGV